MPNSKLWMVCLSVVLSGCTASQWYGGAQYSQQQRCQKIVNRLDREQCLARAQTSYRQYQQAREAVLQPTMNSAVSHAAD